MSQNFRITVNYTGLVQGVGFRWQVNHLAQSTPCTGYVKNLRDGSVEVVMEGRKKDLLDLIECIECKMDGYWQDKTMDERSGYAHFEEFSIRNHWELLHDGTKKASASEAFQKVLERGLVDLIDFEGEAQLSVVAGNHTENCLKSLFG